MQGCCCLVQPRGTLKGHDDVSAAASTWAKRSWLSGRYDVADYAGGSSGRTAAPYSYSGLLRVARLLYPLDRPRLVADRAV